MSSIMQMIFSTATAIAAASDSFFNRVSLLLSGNGPNAATNNTFLDSSTSALTVTRGGSASQGSFSPYAPTGWSVNFGTANGNKINFTSQTVGTHVYTIECWIKPDVANSVNTYTMISGNSTDSVQLFQIYPDGHISTYIGAQAPSSATGVITFGQWQHIALVVNGASAGSAVMYVNGTSVWSTNFGGSLCSIDHIGGAGGAATYNIWGSISNFRATNTAVYTADFTPPTAPLTAITGTLLLLCQSNRFKDNGPTNKALTVVGAPFVQVASPVGQSSSYTTAANGGSVYLPGSGDTLSITAGLSNFAFGTGDFTVEAWVYQTTTALNVCMPSTGANTWGFLTFSNTFYWQEGGANVYSSGSVVSNQWVHLAVSRSGGNLYRFVNGALISTNANSYNHTALPNRIIGSAGGGFVSDLRVIKGTGLYTVAFTPPSAPLTAVTNTTLLLAGTNGAIIDSTSKSDLITSTTATTSTVASKFGGSSMLFNGSTSSIRLPVNQNMILPTGNFTIEFWINPDATQGSSPVVININGGTNPYVQLGWYNASNWGIVFGSGWSITNGTPPTAGVWSHVAFVRNGTTLTYYLNGVSSGTPATNTSSLANVTADMCIGAFNSSSNYYKGYLDDIRVTQGVARYTTTFTPPSAAFPTN